LDFIIPKDLTTTELAAIAPQMSKTYPKTPVQLRMYVGTITETSFHTEQDIALLQLPLFMEFSPVVNNVTVSGFTLEMTLQFGLNIMISIVNNTNQMVTGSITSLDFDNATVVETSVGNINENLLVSTINGVFEVVEATINVFLAQGIQLPSILSDTSIYFQNGETQGATDFELSPSSLLDLLLPLTIGA
jgi:hypothetical protein